MKCDYCDEDYPIYELEYLNHYTPDGQKLETQVCAHCFLHHIYKLLQTCKKANPSYYKQLEKHYKLYLKSKKGTQNA